MHENPKMNDEILALKISQVLSNGWLAQRQKTFRNGAFVVKFIPPAEPEKHPERRNLKKTLKRLLEGDEPITKDRLKQSGYDL